MTVEYKGLKTELMLMPHHAHGPVVLPAAGL